METLLAYPLPSIFRDDGQKQVRRILGIMVNLVEYSFAAANVVRNIFHIGGARHAGGEVQAGDLQADTVSFFK